MNMMMAAIGGGADANILLPGTSTVYTTGFGVPAIGVFRLANDKKIYSGANYWQYGGSYMQYYELGSWLAAGGTVSDYEVRATVGEGSIDSGSAATGSWLSLSTTRDWSMTDNTANTSDEFGGAVQGYITIEIRKAATQRIVGRGTASFNCQRYS